MADPKDGPGKKIWNLVGVSVVVLAGVIVLMFIIGSMFPMAISSFNSGMNNIANEMRNSVSSAINTNIAISMFTTGWIGVFIKILLLIILFMGVGLIGKWIIDSIQKKANP